MQNLPTTSNPDGMQEESVADVDEPPDPDQRTPRAEVAHPTFSKTFPASFSRKQSLLTQILHHDNEDELNIRMTGLRGLSTASSASIASTAELTSDDGATSGTRTSTPSPPLPSAQYPAFPPIFNRTFTDRPALISQGLEEIDPLEKPKNTDTVEKKVEIDLGRKRCIKFACGPKETPPKLETTPATPLKESAPATPPKRKCALRFACPTRASSTDAVAADKPQQPQPRRLASPPPKHRRQSPHLKLSPKFARAHRNSDSTVRNDSPKSVRKVPSVVRPRAASKSSDVDRSEAVRFHEFASSEEEIDEWTQESTCHRSRLTVNDTLKVENQLRQLAREVEEEEIEEDAEENLDDDPEAAELELEDDDDDEHPSEIDEYEESDDGFQTDDEGGFDSSDDESDVEEEYRWWTPGRTAPAPAAEQLDTAVPSMQRRSSRSSIDSLSSAHFTSSRPSFAPGFNARKKRSLARQDTSTPELPDSTDFVCGTLDEDRPLEEAYMASITARRAAKHKMTPQDIDPTFPTSDPEMDDEDKESADEPVHPASSISPQFSGLDEVYARPSRRPSYTHSPQRLRSPPPAKRNVARSPPPPAAHRSTARSPPPRRLFGQSPKRMRSPPPAARLRSPPPSRRTSFTKAYNQNPQPCALAERPRLTHASSLPRRSHVYPHTVTEDDENDDVSSTFHARGAIDIVKGLERKRLRRKEKLYQKYCRKAGKEKERRPQPGKGAERMRELGMELAGKKGSAAGNRNVYMLSL
ncbi:hypothetical protein K402DRAFT_336809 [Aulographum hederae CBS 113979]|uniref:Extensin domain-containing protein n=1 Tax=Aulographum hederae CBS 113979 TaxID=1176131 RepID=A0A6G1GU76_9PEZI|nr:hypothetical protein K402DRAFT_336809 [Aulographum hederae CBS 113979]